MNARIPLVALVALTGCGQALTREEANEALEESQLSTQALNLTGSTVEISTNFKIGDAVEAAATELRSFYASQLPCAEVTVTQGSLRVEYGVNGTCLYKGQRFSGTHQVTISKNDQDEVIVDHVWEDLANAQVEVSGTATVTWNFADPSRHVVHHLDWTRLSDGRTGTGTGDRVQKPLSGGLFEGISIDGNRTWDGAAGHWDLDIDQAQIRWIDPVPQAGTYTLETPYDKAIALSFERLDSTTIKVTVTGPNKSFDFTVKSLPSE